MLTTSMSWRAPLLVRRCHHGPIYPPIAAPRPSGCVARPARSRWRLLLRSAVLALPALLLPAVSQALAPGTKILYFGVPVACQTCDAVPEITALGAIYTKTSNAADLNLSNMNNFHMVWIGSGAGFANWSNRCTDLLAYVNGGGSLVIGAPKETGDVPCLPANLAVKVTGSINCCGGHTILEPGICFLTGIQDSQLYNQEDVVPVSSLGRGWTVATVVGFNANLAGMLFARLGTGQIAWTNARTVGATAFLDKFVTCLARPGATPVTCDVQLSQASYSNGQTVTANVVRLTNPGTQAVPVELKLWFEVPGQASAVNYASVGHDGKVSLPPGTTTVGPLSLVPVTAALPRGPYEFNCRVTRPATNELVFQDYNPFTIQ